MKVRDYFAVDLACCLDMDCCTGKCSMGNFRRIKFQFILPQSYWKQALEACHENMGHLGIERTTALLKDRLIGHPSLRMWKNMLNPALDVSGLKPNLRKLS